MKNLWNKQCENNIIIACCLFACLFLYHHTREFFTHTVTSPLPVKWCKFWPMLDWWPLSGEGSNACHTFSDTGHPLIVISDEPWHTHLCCVQQSERPRTRRLNNRKWRHKYCLVGERFLCLRSVAAGIRTTNLPLAGRTL